ncbi:hypothetical protein M5G07_09220 [Serratia symbiotica]|nr:hypothetical protein [Serratia symbiotica]
MHSIPFSARLYFIGLVEDEQKACRICALRNQLPITPDIIIPGMVISFQYLDNQV